mmetsp:Transcript_18806/g.44050  ORF Transcript_18806/g.44050 Transcript_18806/m.44050 type:complete len:155 (+) Transcript_18806:30-494(+)
MPRTVVAVLALLGLGLALVQAGTKDEYFGLNSTRTNCGGNCPGGCDSCPCGESKDYVNIAAACAKFSGWSQSCCECIVKHESSGNAHADNENVGGSYDVGVWQVNSMNWASCSGGKPPCDEGTNLECAKKVFAWGGNTWKLWSTCGGCDCCHRA